MTREHKLSLILGFAVVLVVGVLLSDHLSGARQAQLDQVDPGTNLALVDPMRSVTQPPSLVLVDAHGRPVNIAAAPRVDTATTTEDQLAVNDSNADPFGDRTMFRPVDQAGSESGRLGWLKDQLAGAVNDLANGTGPTPAAAINEIPTLRMTGRPEAAPPTQSSGSVRMYTVRPNDSLWAIAQRTLGDGFRHKELAKLNSDRLGPNGELRVGTSLLLPADAQLADARPSGNAPELRESSSAKPASNPKAATTKPGSKYTVKPGDTLGEISQRLLGSSRRMGEILEANRERLDDADSLRAGMVLNIPAR